MLLLIFSISYYSTFQYHTVLLNHSVSYYSQSQAGLSPSILPTILNPTPSKLSKTNSKLALGPSGPLDPYVARRSRDVATFPMTRVLLLQHQKEIRVESQYGVACEENLPWRKGGGSRGGRWGGGGKGGRGGYDFHSADTSPH